MKLLFFFLAFLSATAIYSQTELDPSNFVPDEHVLFDKVYGDLNKDGLEDCVLIIKATDRDMIVRDDQGEAADRNRRGIILLLNKNGQYEVAVKNLDCFYSENEDGGNYFAPELSVAVRNGNLILHYGHGRYGHWKYTFRYENNDLELIGYDSSENRGPVVSTVTSINYLTGKKLTKRNIGGSPEEEDEIFEETWEDIGVKELVKLSEIDEF